MSDELARLRDIEARLDRIASADPEISEYRRVGETDALGAVLGVLKRTRQQRDAYSEALILMGQLFEQALTKARHAVQRLSRETLH